MMTFTRLVPHPLILLSRSPIGCGWRRPPAWPASRSPRASTPNPVSAATCPGASGRAHTRWPHSGLRDGTAP